MNRPKTAGGKKTVGFLMHGTKIEPPEEHKSQLLNTGNQFKNVKTDFKNSKAREFETFKQIPRFSHANLAVINPPPFKE